MYNGCYPLKTNCLEYERVVSKERPFCFLGEVEGSTLTTKYYRECNVPPSSFARTIQDECASPNEMLETVKYRDRFSFDANRIHRTSGSTEVRKIQKNPSTP